MTKLFLAVAATALLATAGCAAPAAHLATGDTGVNSPLAQAMQNAGTASYVKQGH